MKVESQYIGLRLAAITGAIVVMAGAFGAHALEDFLIEVGHVDTWETASLYGLLHMGWPMWFAQRPARLLAAWCWVLGVWLFSGSLGLVLGGYSFLAGYANWRHAFHCRLVCRGEGLRNADS